MVTISVNGEQVVIGISLTGLKSSPYEQWLPEVLDMISKMVRHGS